MKQSSSPGLPTYSRVYEVAEMRRALSFAAANLLRVTQHLLLLPCWVPQPRHRDMFYVSCCGI